MAKGLQVWSQTAANNATADTNINFAEGQSPSSLNDSARSMMASVASWRDDNNGTLATSGTSAAYTVVSNQVESALTSGYTLALQFHATTNAAATLAVDGLTAKPLQISSGVSLPYGAYRAGDIGCFTYSSTGTGQWIAAPAAPQRTLTNVASFAGSGVAGVALKMGGLGATLAFTPLTSSRSLITVTCYVSNAGAAQTVVINPVYGTGTAPVAGAAASGTGFAAAIAWVAAAGGTLPFTTSGIISGTTIGTAYWVDFQISGSLANGVQPINVTASIVDI